MPKASAPLNETPSTAGSYVTTGVDFPVKRSRNYPDDWFDGQQWVLTPDAFGGKDPADAQRRTYLRQKARDRGLELQDTVDADGNLIIQAITPGASPVNPLRSNTARTSNKMMPGSREAAKKTGKKVGKKTGKKSRSRAAKA